MREPTSIDAARMRRAADQLEEVAEAHRRTVEAAKGLRAAIIGALEVGAPIPAIADAAGLSPGRIYQIRTEERRVSRGN